MSVLLVNTPILISYNHRGGRSGSEGIIFTKYIIQYTNDIGINILINKFVLTSSQEYSVLLTTFTIYLLI